MNVISESDADATLRGQAQIWQYIYSALDAMPIRCCLELRIPDIINGHGRPITLSQIACEIASPSLNPNGLARLMRFLVHKKVFDEMPQPEEGAEAGTLYSLNHCSNWLLRDSKLTLAPLAMMVTSPTIVSPLHFLRRSISEGGTAVKKAYGEELWDLASHDAELNTIFNMAMVCTTRITMDVMLSRYESGFLGLKGTVVDVGGGVGTAVAEIAKAYPHLKGVNFDLPHVIADAPTYEGVTHVAGDMFQDVPPAESILMNFMLHNWSDDDCVKILQNCRKAIPKKDGRVIIVDVVLQPGGDGIFDNTRHVFDFLMFTYFSTGKERTENEWKKILEKGGFYRYNIIKIPALHSIIEAFLQ